MTIYDCIIVGAGASGLFCAAVSGGKLQNGDLQNRLILEKTKRLGTKLLMSGGGQCNITHSGSMKDFPACYGENGKKVRSCLYKYNNQHLVDFLRQNGIPTITREDGKIFPRSMKAEDIRAMLIKKAAQNGFQIRCDAEVSAIKMLDNAPSTNQNPILWQVETSAGQFQTRNLIIAAGGCSYPVTGSDGSILQVLKRDLAMEIITPRPALTPIYVENYPYAEESGIAFLQAELQIWSRPINTKMEGKTEENPPVKSLDYKKIRQICGPLLLTHENFSGPLILNFSKYIKKNDRIVINYLYPCKKEEVLEKILLAQKNSKMQLTNLLAKELNLPKSFVAAVIAQTGEKPKAIAEKLTADTFTVVGPGSFKKAMATAGGVSLSEINPKTMEVKSYPGLYVIGETLDVDGETGGYNLQFAYASACAAADAIKSKQKGEGNANQ